MSDTPPIAASGGTRRPDDPHAACARVAAWPMDRRRLLTAGAPLALAATLPSPAPTAQPGRQPDNARHVLDRLLAGNLRFAAGRSVHPHQRPARQHLLAQTQHPFVITVACTDSRVTPEILFDQGIGDVFDNRVVGNIIDDLVLAGIDYALTHFRPPLIMVLGHQRCGAVIETLDAVRARTPAAGSVATIVGHLRGIAESALNHPGDPVAHAVHANVRAQISTLLQHSTVVSDMAAAGTVGVVGAVYDLDTGRVSVLH